MSEPFEFKNRIRPPQNSIEISIGVHSNDPSEFVFMIDSNRHGEFIARPDEILEVLKPLLDEQLSFAKDIETPLNGK